MMRTVAMARKVAFAALAAVLAVISTEMAFGLVLENNEQHGYVEYLGITGVLEGRDAPYRLVVPGRWNGTLLVYARAPVPWLDAEPTEICSRRTDFPYLA
jgi:hypothetical protein